MLHLNEHPNLQEYKSASIYLKDETVHKVTVKGNIEAVDWDNHRLSVKTTSEYSVFTIEDILGITFEK